MISRRSFLHGAGALAGSLAVRSTSLAAQSSMSQTPMQMEHPGAPAAHTVPAPHLPAALDLDPDKLNLYADPLPLLPRVQPVGTRHDHRAPGKALPYYRLAMQEHFYKVHRDLPPARAWGFNGVTPGPLFDVCQGQPILVEWANELPTRHFLPIDYTIMGAEHDKPDVRATIHLHGGRVPSDSDGFPEDWLVPGQSHLFLYTNVQDATTLAYHDHTMGINRLNIYAGLQGLYLLRDSYEDSLELPSGPYELPLIVYDRFVRTDGQFDYPVSDKPDAPWVPEVYSNCMLANGVLGAYHEVEPRLYRLRFLNGSNGRFFRLSIGEQHGHGLLDLHHIGSDQGLLPSPLAEKKFVLAPAERADILVDFSSAAGTNLLLRSDSFDILQFRVAAAKPTTAVSKPIPASLRPVERIPESQATRTRRLTLDENMNNVQQSMGMLLNNTHWHEPITENPKLGSTEIWEIVNLTEDSHPIHIHLVRFQLLDRRLLDDYLYGQKAEVRWTGEARPATGVEAGWKDTVRCDPGEMTRIIIPWEKYTGKYVWHCHLLEHEDNEMMRPIEVLPA